MADQGPDAIDCTAAQGWDGIAAALARAAVRVGAAPGTGVLVRLGAGDYRGCTPLAVPAGVTLAGDPGARSKSRQNSDQHLIRSRATRKNGA